MEQETVTEGGTAARLAPWRGGGNRGGPSGRCGGGDYILGDLEDGDEALKKEDR